MEKTYFNLDDFPLSGKTVLIRLDLNAPYDEKTGLSDSPRFAEHALTLKELSKKGARTVILAHQGRPYSQDFLSLKNHAPLLSKHVGAPVLFFDNLASDAVLSQIQSLQNGQIALLENVRFFSEETEEAEHADQFLKSLYLQRLCGVCDFFVNDAFSAAHRLQASLVGPTLFLPSAAGRVMERELNGLSKAIEHVQHPNVYVLGGAKPDDVFSLLKFAAASKAVDHILVSGILGELCLLSQGVKLAPDKMNLIQEEGYDALLPELAALLSKFSSKIEVPSDLAVLENGKRVEYPVVNLSKAKGPSFDLGTQSIARFKSVLASAKTVYFKGPVGKYEDALFERGTKEILTAIVSGKAYSIMGGGHSLSAMQKFNIPLSKISHVSLAGGAVVAYLQGKPLPAVDALKAAFAKGTSKSAFSKTPGNSSKKAANPVATFASNSKESNPKASKSKK